MERRAKELLDKTQQLNETPFGPEMEPLSQRYAPLANDMLVAWIKNSDGVIDAVEGEGGQILFTNSYRMTDMPLLPRSGKNPEPAPTLKANP